MDVADTSALYALLDAGDAHHGEAKARVASGRPILVPSEIWHETVALLQYRFGHGAALDAAKALRALPNLEVQPTPDDPWDDVAGEARSVHASHRKLSPLDACVVAWAKCRGLGLFAFDRALLDALKNP